MQEPELQVMGQNQAVQVEVLLAKMVLAEVLEELNPLEVPVQMVELLEVHYKAHPDH